MKKKAKILQPGDTEALQLGLFSAANTGDYSALADYPPVYRDVEGFRKVLAGVTDLCGLDYEFNTTTLRPTVIGISNYVECAAVWYTPEIQAEVERARKERGFAYSGHAVLTADRQVLESAVGYLTNLADWSDSMLTFWLANADLCLLGSSLVCTENGPMAIETIVSTKWSGRVHCVIDGQPALAQVTGWHRSRRNGRKMLKVQYAFPCKGTVTVTDDHMFLTEGGHWIAAEELTSGNFVATGEDGLVEESARFLAGMLLGDSYVGRGTRLEIMHGDAQEEYLLYKTQLLHQVGKVSRRRVGTSNRVVARSSKQVGHLNYLKNKSLTAFIGRHISPAFLAAWYLDDGTLAADRRMMEISASSYSDAEGASMARVISAGTGLDCWYRRSPSGRGVLVFSADSSRKLARMIAPWVPPTMRYKIDIRGGSDIPEFDASKYDPEIGMLYAAVKVSKSAAAAPSNVFCIDVAAAGNFKTLAGIVHNCKAPSKEEDQDGGLGFMGLGTMVSLTTDLPHHKTCRGRNCEELICPRHDVRGYCAIDAYGGLLGDVKSRETLRSYGMPSSSITFLHRLAELAKKMSDYGVAVDRRYVDTLAASMVEEQEKLFPGPKEDGFVFNPRSPKAVLDWSRDNKIFLAATDKDAVQTALEKAAGEAGYLGDKFEDVRDALDRDIDSLEPALKTLYKLYTYKVLGKGTDSWFHERYFGADGLLHPRFVVTGTSTGRFSSSRPNFQNIPKRGWGKKVRKAFVPREKGNVIVEADFSQLELRICLYLAEVDPTIIGADAFSWLVSKSGGLFDKAAERFGGKPRDIAKSISHAANYLEGLRLLEPAELDYSRTKSEVEAGAIRIYHPRYMDGITKEWTFHGKVVAFTGSNLAQRLFKSKSFENRRKALEIQEDIYFKAFPQIRRWQQKALGEAETTGYVSSPAGRFLRLYDTPEKNAKIIVAFLGQGVGASHVQSIMLQYNERHGTVFLGQIHDALLAEFPVAGGYRAVYDHMKEMEEETPLLPGFRCPCKVEVGKHWGAMEELFEKDGELWLGKEKVS